MWPATAARMRGWADFGRREANSKGVAQDSPWRWSAPLVRAGWRGRGARVDRPLLAAAARCEIHRSIDPQIRSRTMGPVAGCAVGGTGNAGAPGPPPGGAAQGPPRLGRTPATTVAAPTGLHARPRPRRLCLCAAGPKEAAQQALASWGGALGDGGVERAAGLGRRALGHPVHPAPGTPLPPEVTPRLPPRLSPPPPCVLHLAAPCSFVQNA